MKPNEADNIAQKICEDHSLRNYALVRDAISKAIQAAHSAGYREAWNLYGKGDDDYRRVGQ
jgi:hypothetical protein